MIKKGVFILILVCCCSMAKAQKEYYPASLEGKSKAELKTVLHNIISIHSVANINDIIAVFKITDAREDGTAWSLYTHDKISFTDFNASLDFDRLVSPSWSGDKYPLDHELSYDLHQITPAPIDVISNKKEFPVGKLTKTTYTNGVWSAGYAMLLGTEINAFEPADEYKGDVARMMMYIATCYSQYQWESLAINIFTDNAYPTLNKYSRELLLAWHRADPVSKKEIDRNNAVHKIQGNRNPFVDYPILAEHIWGNKMDVGFEGSEKPENTLIPLRAKYKITDERIDLYSPHIPDNVTWSVNGKSTALTQLSPKDLGVGVHELRYSSNVAKGKLLITIIP